MGFLLQFTEENATFRGEDISKTITGVICSHMVDFVGLVTNIRSTGSFTGDCEKRCLMVSKRNQQH